MPDMVQEGGSTSSAHDSPSSAIMNASKTPTHVGSPSQLRHLSPHRGSAPATASQYPRPNAVFSGLMKGRVCRRGAGTVRYTPCANSPAGSVDGSTSSSVQPAPETQQMVLFLPRTGDPCCHLLTNYPPKSNANAPLQSRQENPEMVACCLQSSHEFMHISSSSPAS